MASMGASAEPPHLVCSGEMRLLNANGVAIENTICLSALPFSEQFCSDAPMRSTYKLS